MRIKLLAVAFLIVALPSASYAEEGQHDLYIRSCRAGVIAAVAVLGPLEEEASHVALGYAACYGTLARLVRTNKLHEKEDLSGFACRYGIVMVFMSQGAVDEVQAPVSIRVSLAERECGRVAKETV